MNCIGDENRKLEKLKTKIADPCRHNFTIASVKHHTLLMFDMIQKFFFKMA